MFSTGSCLAARATVCSFSRILPGKSRSNFPHARRVSGSELGSVRAGVKGSRNLDRWSGVVGYRMKWTSDSTSGRKPGRSLRERHPVMTRWTGRSCAGAEGETMDAKARLRLARVIGVACILAVGVGCNMPGLGKDSDFASQSQALSGGGNQAAGSGGQSGGGAGYGSERLEYDHNFAFDFSGSNNTVHVEITVKGVIPVTTTQNAMGPWECVDRTLDGLYEQVSGSATIPFQGSADWTSGDDHCSCSLADSLQVNIMGKTYYEWLQADEDCPTRMIALQVKEKWFTEHEWQCVCDDPRKTEKLHVAESMAMFPSVANPELEKKTMIFPIGCPEESSLEATLSDPSGMGSGSYRWTFRSGVNEPSDPGRRVNQPNPLAQDADQWSGDTPIVGFGTCPPGEWGPPLESIVQPASKWFPIEPASSP